jgi:hypothetical protein
MKERTGAPSPGPRRLRKAPSRATLSPEGERAAMSMSLIMRACLGMELTFWLKKAAEMRM